MTDIRSDIIINVDTSIGITEIKNLQRQIAELNAQLLQSGAQQARAAQNIQRNLINNINATGKFAASVRTISSTAESFTTALERNKLGMGEYFRYAGGASKTFGRLFKKEFDTIEQVAKSRVKTLQTQYIKLGRDANGALKAIAVRPLALDMENLATKTAIAAQKQQLFNQLIKQGSTNLLNFGKNTQWAGRQLMVGFTIPLTYLGVAAGKTFMKMEEQAIRFKRVYGDAFTATEETDKMIKQVQDLAKEFTKYGVQVEKTMEMAADAAAMGLMNADLLAQVNQATRLAVLGGVEQQQALETTISLMNAFGTTSKDLAKDIDFLNAVENQTVTAIEDLTIAIPKAAPVIKQLGGDVKDLAFFLTAMKEGGINASEGANALKSGLASLINPTEKAAQFLQGFGINLRGIVNANKGDVKGIVVSFARALDDLDPLNRARAIEQLFGKFQFARLSTLFQNVIKDGSQASRVLQLTANSTEELAILSERELKRVEDSPMFKFKKAVEDLRTALVPLGEAFVKAITPVVEFAKGFLDRFNAMGEGAKNFAVVATTIVAGIGPVLLMTFGLIANGVANVIKMFAAISRVFSGAGKSSTDLGSQTEYMTQQQLEAAAVASSLDQKHSKLIQTFSAEAGAVNNLATAYARAVVAQSKLLNIPLGPTSARGAASTKPPMKLKSGIVSVPGPKGAGDIVPAMLSPGEAVIPARQSQKYAGLISGMINDDIPGFKIGRNPFAGKFNPRWGIGESIVRFFQRNRENYGPNYDNKLAESFLRRPGKNVAVRMFSDDFAAALARGDKRYKNIFETGGKSRGSLDEAGGQRALAEEKLFGISPNADPRQRPAYGYLFNRDMDLVRPSKPGILERLTGIKRSRMADPYSFAKSSIGEATKLMNKNTYRYGDIAMVLKNRALRGRTTITQGDSLNAFMDQYATPARLGTRSRTKLRAATPSRGNREFFEAQILGGFSFKDIKRIVATEPETILRLQQALQDAGIRGIKVGMPQLTMMQRLQKLVYGSRATQQKLPRIQPESAGPYAGKYRNDPLILNGKQYWFDGGIADEDDAAKPVPTIKPTSKSFDYDYSLQAAHLSPAALNFDGTENFTKQQAIERIKQEYAKGVKLGLFADSSVMRENLKETIANIQASKKTTFKLYGNTIGLMTTSLNQAWANKSATISASEALKKLELQPKGMLPGSQIKSMVDISKKLGLSGYDVADTSLKNYSLAVDTELRNRLKLLGSTQISEDQFHRIYADSADKALSRLPSGPSKDAISRIRQLSSLNLSAGFVSPGASGPTRPATMSVFRKKMQDVVHSTRSGLKGVFGSGYSDDFLTKSKLQGISRSQKDAISSMLKGLTGKEYKEAAQRIIDAHAKGKTDFARLLSVGLETSQASENKTPGKPGSKSKSMKAAPKPTRIDITNLMSAVDQYLGDKPTQSSPRKTRGFGRFRFNSGVVSVPGPKGAGDIVPAMLTPGEAVIPADMSRKYAPLISGMISDSIPGFKDGLPPSGPKKLPPGFDKFQPQQQPIVPQTPADQKRFGNAIGSAMGKAKEVSKGLASGTAKALKNTIVGSMDDNTGLLGRLGRSAAIRLGNISGNDVVDSKGNVVNSGAERAKGLFGVPPAPRPGSIVETNGRFFQVDEQGKKVRVSNAAAQQMMQNQQAQNEGPRAKLGSRIMGPAGAMGAVASMAGMGMMMSGDPAMSGAGGAIASAGMLVSMLPMIMNPLGGIIAAIAAVGGGFLLLNNHLNSVGAAARKTAESLGVGSKVMNEYAKFANNVSASEVMDRRRAESLSPFSIQAGKNEFGASFLQSEGGKSLLQNVRSARSAGVDFQGALFNQLAAAVSGGSLDVTQARSVAYAITEALGEQSVGMDINARLTALFGPNGENLLSDPLSIQIKTIDLVSVDLQKAQTDLENALNGSQATIEAWQKTTSENAMGEIEKLAKENPFIAFMTSIPLAKELLEFLTGSGPGIAPTSLKQAELSVEAISAYTVKATNAIQSYQSAVDALDVSYDKQIAAAKAAGDEAKAQELINERAQKRNELMTKYAEAMNVLRKNFDETNDADKTRLLAAADDRLAEKFQGDDAKILAAANQALQTNQVSQGNQYELKMLLNADAITLSTFDWISNNMSDTSITRVLNLDAKLTGKDLGTMTSLLARFGSERTQQEFIAKFELAADSAEATEILNTFTEIASLADTMGEKNAQEMLDFYVDPKNQQQATALADTIQTLKDFDGEKLTIDYIQNIEGGDKFAKIIKGNQKYFDSLDKDQQITYTQIIATVSMSDPMDLQGDAVSWAASRGKLPSVTGPYSQKQTDQAVIDYVNYIAEQRTRLMKLLGLNDDGEDDPDTPADTKKDPFEDILKDLKRLRDAAINTKGGLKELRDYLNKKGSGESFIGVESQLLERGFSAPLASYFAGLDEDAQKVFFTIGKNGKITLKETARLMKEAFDRRALGDVFTQIKGMTTAIKQKNIATKKLVGFGLDYATAVELAADEEVAAAIASGKNEAAILRIVAAKREEVKLLKESNALTEARLAIEQNIADEVVRKNVEGRSLEEQRAISNSPELIAMIENGQQDTETFRKLLAQELAKIVQQDIKAASDAVRQAIKDFNADNAVRQFVDTRFESSVLQQLILGDDQLTALIKEAQNAGTVLGKEFYDRLNQLLGDEDALKKVFDNGMAMAADAFSVQEQAIDIKFRTDTSYLTDPENGIIPVSERQIESIQYKIDDYDAALKQIQDQEEVINEKYDLRFEALQKVLDVTENINKENQAQLDIANAISQGDIAGAARAVQSFRADQAKQRIDQQKQMLEKSREQELAALTSKNGLTRKQNEEEIKKLKDQIFLIEENTLEPAQRALALAEDQRDIAISNVTVLGMSRLEWDGIQNNIDLARINNDKFNTSLLAALSVVTQLKTEYEALGKVNISAPPAPGSVTTTTVAPVAPPANTPNVTTAPEAPSLETKPEMSVTEKQIAELNRRIAVTRWRYYNEKGLTAAQKKDLIELNEKRIRFARELGGPNAADLTSKIEPGKTQKIIDLPTGYAMGGLVKPKYLRMGGLLPYKSEGGMIFKPLGTDTIPAMLSPGEFVVRKYAVDNFGVDNLKAINSGSYTGGSMYNYEVNVNVKSDANPDQIARAVMSQIKQIDSQRIRGNRF